MCEKRLCPAPAGQDGVGSPHTERTLAARLRGLLALVMCLCLTLALLPAPAYAATPATSWTDAKNYNIDWYGDGGATSFTISTAEELAGLAYLSNNPADPKDFAGKTITLAADIDLSAHLWQSIGQYDRSVDSFGGDPVSFKGTFLGGGHTIQGMTISKENSSSAPNVAGFFGELGATAQIDNLRLLDASITKSSTWGSAGLLAAIVRKGAIISDCTVTGSIDFSTTCSRSVYVGGLVAKNSGTIKNCGVHLTSITGNGGNNGTFFVGGIAGRKNYIVANELYPTPPEEEADGTVENCYATVDAVTLSGATTTTYALVPGASHSYWSAASMLTDSGAPSYTHSYAVTAEQIAGTGSTNIGTGSTYAETTSLITALNNWVASNAGHSKWKLKNGMPVQMTFLPTYIDVGGPLDEVTHQSATGDIDVGMDLEGQIQEKVTLLSVTLPASIPFIVDVETDGAFKRVLSATGTLTNRSDCGVKITLTAVTDNDGLLDKADLFLVPDPAPSADKPQIDLIKGEGKTDLLAALAAPAKDGTPTTATLKVDGAAKSDVASIGNDGDQFVVGLTLKVSKQ